MWSPSTRRRGSRSRKDGVQIMKDYMASGAAGRVAWRRGPGPFWGAVEAGEEAVEGSATAESSATGCGADHDRMTSVPSRSSEVSRWRHGIRAWGRGEPATNDPAA